MFCHKSPMAPVWKAHTAAWECEKGTWVYLNPIQYNESQWTKWPNFSFL